MNKQIEKIIELAKEQVGYRETGSNITKYAADFDSKYPDFYNYKKQGVAWCDIFVDWLFVTAFGEDKALKMLCQPKKSAGAGCKYSAEYYAKNNRFFDDPEAGDQVFFLSNNGINHTGIVVAVDDKKVYTIEGNSSDTVKAHSYALSNKKIAGYGRPIWDEEAKEIFPAVEKPNETDVYYTVRKGDTLTAIAKMYNTTVAKLQAINKISDPDYIVVGEKILLPKGAAESSGIVEDKPLTFIGVVATIRDPLNIRSGAGKQYNIIGQLAKGSKIELKIDDVNGWYKLVDRDGYVAANLIKTD